MKKQLFIVISLIALLSVSCKKSETDTASPTTNNRTIVYQYSGPALNYAIAYTNTDGLYTLEPVSLLGVGTGPVPLWTRTVTIKDVTVTRSCALTVSCPTVTTSTQIILSIIDGSKTVTSQAVFTSNTHDLTLSYNIN